MEIYLGLCDELQSYETQVIMDSKFSSKNFNIDKYEISPAGLEPGPPVLDYTSRPCRIQ